MWELRRFVYIACHRGPAAAALFAERRWHDDRFEMVEICGSGTPGKSYSHFRRAGTAMHYRFTQHAKRKVVLELREVERLFWPDGAQIDPRTARDRRWAKRGNPILEEARVRSRGRKR